MFIMYMPEDFKVKDSREVVINGTKTQLTYTDIHTLTIGASDRRRILSREVGDDRLACFICSDSERDIKITTEELPGGSVTSVDVDELLRDAQRKDETK
ncbi:MAG TPA: hypothetical protein VMH89_11880 [Candidatus Acidoferrum sp.]|nr:hypothetical protein [Candidatus Acidoferrum sp.]